MNSANAEIMDLVARLAEYQRSYYVDGHSQVSDLEYDRLFDRLLALEAAHPELRRADSPTQRVGSDLDTSLAEREHTIPVLSLDKAYTAFELLQWIEKTEKKGESEVGIVIEEKIDGISIVLYYEDGLLDRAVTRGNGFVGNDVTENVKTIASVPLSIPTTVAVAVRGEIYLPKASFASLNAQMETPYANPRNLAAGTIRRIKSREVAMIPLEIFVYEGFWEGSGETHLEILSQLARWGFPLNKNLAYFHSDKERAAAELQQANITGIGASFEDLASFIEEETGRRGCLAYEIDGLVAKVNSIEARQRLGYTGHHPRWAMAYKFESPQAETVVEGIDVQVGRSGRITPVARLKPVQLAGSTISNVTLHNQDYIAMLELGVGDTVEISRRGDVIPAVERVLEKGEGAAIWQVPTHCPVCHTALVKGGAHTFCPNVHCPAQVRGRIEFFAGKGGMDIENFGPETIATLMELGVLADIDDIYRIDYEAVLGGQPGFGERKIALIRAGVDESKTRPFRTVLVALGIPELGKKGAQVLIEAGLDSMEKLLAVADANDTERLVSIKQIGERSAEVYIASLTDEAMRRRIASLAELGLSMEEARHETGDDQRFAGQVWCVTGSFEHFNPRSKAMDEVEARGGRTTGSVTSKTTHLLAGAGGGSKRARALEHGVTIVDEETFISLLNKEDKNLAKEQGELF
ncbi:MAG: NAD-dependent DNA ligase LigA [Sphaerochaeta sp.]|nr:NAD-dependent DNA ligase LigA [Sphaerochaeta sp.]